MAARLPIVEGERDSSRFIAMNLAPQLARAERRAARAETTAVYLDGLLRASMAQKGK